jgi:hypothetical protein
MILKLLGISSCCFVLICGMTGVASAQSVPFFPPEHGTFSIPGPTTSSRPAAVLSITCIRSSYPGQCRLQRRQRQSQRRRLISLPAPKCSIRPVAEPPLLENWETSSQHTCCFCLAFYSVSDFTLAGILDHDNRGSMPQPSSLSFSSDPDPAFAELDPGPLQGSDDPDFRLFGASQWAGHAFQATQRR